MTDQPAAGDCSWRTLRQPHRAHDWWPDSGGTAHCDGYVTPPAGHDNGPSVTECADADAAHWNNKYAEEQQ